MTVSITTIQDERKFRKYMEMRNAPMLSMVHGVHPNSQKALYEYNDLEIALSGGNETIENLESMAEYHNNAVAAVLPFIAAMQRCMETINKTMHIVNLMAIASGADAPFAIESEEVSIPDYLTTLATAIATLQATQTAMQQIAQSMSGE